ncbi:hypothetical protein QFZ53_001436 [Microbacterium natoriense]|uniref:Uncharacterized protein n=1 Tax=Microbacterium natoriense TaxID=284570 RepID=A0AAW8EWP4_9MICO|nr:hypothetical protein [Microbacterium natoriense]MDQ0647240.1 hypothetical protein [Microbacterium natoriense]
MNVWERLRKPARPLRNERRAFDLHADLPTLRVVIDPLLALTPEVDGYFDLLRRADASILILRRREQNQVLASGDYAVVTPAETPADSGWGGVIEKHENGVVHRAIPFAQKNTESAFNWAKHYGLDPVAARARELDAQAAISLEADLYVTDNEFALHRKTMRSACTVSDALAVIGLHQRLRSRVLVGPEDAQFITSWMAERIQVTAMLPRVDAQFNDVMETRAGDGALSMLRAMLIRLERALAARDRLLVTSLHPNGLIGFEAPDELVERAVVALQGVLDAAARALNAQLTSPVPASEASFSRKSFRAQLPPATRKLVEDSDNRATREIISVLRNTIHNQPFGIAAHEKGGEVERLATVEGEPGEKFRALAAQLKATDRWTLFETKSAVPDLGFGVVLRPIPLIDELIVRCAALSDSLIASAPWATTPFPDAERTGWGSGPAFIRSVQRGYGLDDAVVFAR